MILAWSGSVSSIPAGWKLCDGSNGTPNLRDRFIVGAGSSYSIGNTGGEAFHTLTIAEMPSHHHYWYIGYEWAPVTDTTPFYSMSTFADLIGNNIGGWGGASYPPQATSDVGGNQPHENRPPYYALFFIVRV